MKKRNSELMERNSCLTPCIRNPSRDRDPRSLRHSAPVNRTQPSRHPPRQSDQIRYKYTDKREHSSLSTSSSDGVRNDVDALLPRMKSAAAMPCRCRSVGESSAVTNSPCLITQSRTSSFRKNSSVGTPRNDPAVFDHLRSQLNERHRTFVKKTKPKTPSTSQQEEGALVDVFKDEQTPKLRFKMAAKCVLVLIRWLNAIIDISDTKTIRTATEERWYTLYTSQEAKRLAFNKMVYSKERAFAKVPKWALDIFGRDPDSRSDQDCRRIHALLRGLKSFDKFTERIQLYMCRSFRYQSVEPGRVILRRGHVGINFYFIYSGSVFVNVEDVNTRGEHFEKTETVLARGDSFGELALLQDIRRTATITCRETCELLVVDKETFAKVCPSIFQEELEEKEKFLSKLQLFNQKFWTKDMLKTLCNEAQIQEYKTNKVVATDRRDEEWIYICMQGKGQVVRRLLLDGPSKTKRQRIRSTRSSSRHKCTEVLVNLMEEDNIDSQDESSLTSDESDDEEGKEKMLESMSLDYRKDGRIQFSNTFEMGSGNTGERCGPWALLFQEYRRKAMKTPNKDDMMKRMEDTLFTGPMTLTSLMSKDKENKSSDHIYLQLDTLSRDQVFDIYSIMLSVTSPPDSDVLLVSGGARFLRFKKKNFFQICSREALEHARRIAVTLRYPTDKELLISYTEKYYWDDYKNKVVDQVIRKHVERETRFKNSPQIQASIISYQRQRTLDLINTLKHHP